MLCQSSLGRETRRGWGVFRSGIRIYVLVYIYKCIYVYAYIRTQNKGLCIVTHIFNLENGYPRNNPSLFFPIPPPGPNGRFSFPRVFSSSARTIYLTPVFPTSDALWNRNVPFSFFTSDTSETIALLLHEHIHTYYTTTRGRFWFLIFTSDLPFSTVFNIVAVQVGWFITTAFLLWTSIPGAHYKCSRCPSETIKQQLYKSRFICLYIIVYAVVFCL